MTPGQGSLDTGIPLTGLTSLVFELKTADGAFISLHEDQGQSGNDMYELCFGASGEII